MTKKFLLSLFLMAAFTGYTFLSRSRDIDIPAVTIGQGTKQTDEPRAAQASDSSSVGYFDDDEEENLASPGSAPKPAPAQAPAPTQTTAPSPKPSGAYRDGSYTGSITDAYYGNVQVRAVISGGKITDVQFLDYPQDRNTSREISVQAMPVLASEAIQAQSATVDIVSGATQTSEAFRISLASALAKAKI